MSEIISLEVIVSKILEVRSRRVMLDRDLAMLYGVPVKVLNQAVKRNLKRFPSDFMYQLTWEEVTILKSQIVTSSSRSQFVTLKKGQNIKYLPYVFTQEGVAMLSSVLNSKRAIQVNILIMRAFVKLRSSLSAYRGLAFKLKELEAKIEEHDTDVRDIFEAIRQLMGVPDEHKKITGFAAK
jgi:phage regulator Rha-like protein